MSFPRYPQYKDSGVEWLGAVPAHWDVRRLKNIVKEPLKYGANESAELDDRTLPRFIRITDIDDHGGLRDETFKSLPLDVAEPYLLKEGDILLARSGATVGKSFIYSTQWGAACFAGYLIRARLKHTTCLAQWLYYFCQTDEYWGYVVGTQIQSTIQNVSAEKYANLYLPLPNISEQTQIAAFLDRETAKIDALVVEQRRLMELLKEKRQAIISHAVTKGLNPGAPMKSSGVEWLGDVPAHWDVTPLKWLTQPERPIMYGIVLPGPDVGEGIPILKGGNVKPSRMNLNSMARTTAAIEAPFARARLRESDLVYSIRGTIGDCEPVPADLEGSNITQDVARVAIADNVSASWARWALLSSAIREDLASGSLGAAVRGVNIFDLKRAKIPTPTYDEQIEITTHISCEVGKIDALTAEAQRAIDLLQERRTALISAAVTGQIDVREEFA